MQAFNLGLPEYIPYLTELTRMSKKWTCHRGLTVAFNMRKAVPVNLSNSSLFLFYHTQDNRSRKIRIALHRMSSQAALADLNAHFTQLRPRRQCVRWYWSYTGKLICTIECVLNSLLCVPDILIVEAIVLLNERAA